MAIDSNGSGGVSPNVVWQSGTVSRDERESELHQRGAVVWLTGLSGSGKSTIAGALQRRLYYAGAHSYLLDGDNVRHGLCGDLGFSDEDRVENIRRVSEVAALFVDAGLIVLTAFISPFREDRARARSIAPEGRFYEVFVDTPIEICERRDPKGLYQKARDGQIPNFTGIDSPYEPPLNPEITLPTADQTLEQSVDMLFARLQADLFL